MKTLLVAFPILLLASMSFGQQIVIEDSATTMPHHSMCTFISYDKGRINMGLRFGKTSNSPKKKSAIECRFMFTTTDEYVIELKAATEL